MRLTLDDFGTGATALGNLRRYPVSAVKIDRSFVQQLVHEPICRRARRAPSS